MISAGMISALLAIAVALGMDNQSLTYTTPIAVVNVGFAFLPVFVAFSAARHLGTNEFIAAFISLITLIVFNQQAELNLFSLAVPNIKYMNSIIPVLLMVPLLYAVDKRCDKIYSKCCAFHAQVVNNGSSLFTCYAGYLWTSGFACRWRAS